jgi:hypothetical protein
MKTKFGKFAILGASALTIAALVAGSTPAFADAIPYPNKGIPITVAPVITATGSSVLYYFGFSAADTDVVDIFDITQHTQTGYIFQNNTTGIGSTNALSTNVGDVLVVEDIDEASGDAASLYSSLSAPTGTYTCPSGCNGAPATPVTDSDPGISHTYVTPYSGGVVGGVTIPPGLYLGEEDRYSGDPSGSDYDYNDDQFVLTGVSTSTVPEPGSIALLGTGILAGAGMVRRRLAKA